MFSLHKLRLFLVISVLLLISPQSNAMAAAGRLGNYSLLSGHGGGGVNTQGVLRPDTANDGYAPGNCTHCHEQHASIDATEPAPVNGAPSEYTLFDDLAGNVFCNYCHGAGGPHNGEKIIEPQTLKTYAHKPSGSLIQDVPCHECHNSHEATTQARWVGTNLIDPASLGSGAIKGLTDYVVASWSPTFAAGSGVETIVNATFSAAPDQPVTREYDLCLSCHGGQLVVAGLPNISGQFNPGNFSAHPIEIGAPGTGAYKNTAITSNLTTFLLAPWSNSSTKTMYCSDCHGSDNPTDPAGPHGSNNVYMLKEVGPGPVTKTSGALDNLCDNCHIFDINGPQGLGPSGFDDNTAWNPNPSIVVGVTGGLGDHTLPEHKYPTNPQGCLACHGSLGNPALQSNIHGANYIWNDVAGFGRPSQSFLVGGPITDLYKSTPFATDGYCAATCHASGQAYRYK